MLDADRSPSSTSPGLVETSQPPTSSHNATHTTVDPQVIARRERSIVDGILTNGSLTSGLDQDDTREMLDWSITMAREAARVTAGMDEPQAEKAISVRMYATRKLMRLIKYQIVESQNLSDRSHGDLLRQIHDQAKMIYGEAVLNRTAARELLDKANRAPSRRPRRVADFRQALDPRLNGGEESSDN